MYHPSLNICLAIEHIQVSKLARYCPEKVGEWGYTLIDALVMIGVCDNYKGASVKPK